MKFVAIPRNGASWNEELIYEFICNDEGQRDVIFEIVDDDSSELIGELVLRGVTGGSFNIAPYIRRHLLANLAQPPRQTTLVPSPAAISVVVRSGDISSDKRLFFRAPFDYSTVGVMTEYSVPRRVARGGTILMTISARHLAAVELYGVADTTEKISDFMSASLGHPLDMMLRVDSRFEGFRRLVMRVTTDYSVVEEFVYELLPPMSGGCEVVWHNASGGYEVGTIPLVRRLSDVAKVRSIKLAEGSDNRLVEAYSTLRLSSAMEHPDEMRRMAEIIRSPYVYMIDNGRLSAVELVERRLDYDKHGDLKQLSIDIRQAVKGGVL